MIEEKTNKADIQKILDQIRDNIAIQALAISRLLNINFKDKPKEYEKLKQKMIKILHFNIDIAF